MLESKITKLTTLIKKTILCYKICVTRNKVNKNSIITPQLYDLYTD